MGKAGVYILACGNGRYYIGSTNDLDRRLAEHAAGLVKATTTVLPIQLAFFQPCEILSDARRLEYRLKSFKSRVILEQIIKDGFVRTKS